MEAIASRLEAITSRRKDATRLEAIATSNKKLLVATYLHPMGSTHQNRGESGMLRTISAEDLAAENFCSAASHFLKMGMQVLGKAGVKSQYSDGSECQISCGFISTFQ